MKKTKKGSLDFIKNFKVLSIEQSTARIISELKAIYAKMGVSFGLGDLCIAAQAYEHNLTLITHDKDFQRIKEINVITI